MSNAALLGAIGQLIESIGTARYPSALASTLRLAVPHSHTVTFAFVGAARPVDLFDDFPASRRSIFVADYLAGPYQLDPFYLAASKPLPAGIYRIRDLAPDRFFQGEYYRNYYAKTGLAEEIGIFIDVSPGTTVVTSLMRIEKVFSDRELRTLRDFQPVVLASSRRHWGGLVNQLERAKPTKAGRDAETEQNFASFEQGVLTAREREIVEHTLKGHSAEAIGELLGIKSGTVRIHRRNVYAKLRISSQGELFTRFFQTVGTS